MLGAPVHIDRRPFSAFLVCWGHALDGWWGCCRFTITLAVEHSDDQMPVAAWLPAASIRQPGWSTAATGLPRTHLPGDRAKWPPPAGWQSWYAGAWPDGDLELPPGVTMSTEPGWRRKKR